MVKSKRVLFEFTLKSRETSDVRAWEHTQQLVPTASVAAIANQASSSTQLPVENTHLNSAPQSPVLGPSQLPPMLSEGSQQDSSITPLKLKRKVPTPSPSPSPTAGSAKRKAAKKGEPQQAEVTGDIVKDTKAAENAVKSMVTSLSQTTSAASEIQSNTDTLKTWAWLKGLPQYADFQRAQTPLQEAKLQVPLVQKLTNAISDRVLPIITSFH